MCRSTFCVEFKADALHSWRDLVRKNNGPILGKYFNGRPVHKNVVLPAKLIELKIVLAQ